LYVKADYMAALYALYINNHMKPAVLYAKQHAFVLNGINGFCSPDSLLTKTIFENPAGKPDYCAYAFNGGGRESVDFEKLNGEKVCEFVTVNESTNRNNGGYNITDLWRFA